MKKTISSIIIIFFIICFSVTNVCAEFEVYDEAKNIQNAYQSAMDSWQVCLAATEELYSNILWGLDYIDVFCETLTWQDLSNARKACILLSDYLESYEYPELQLSYEVVDQLVKADFPVVIITEDFMLPIQYLDSIKSMIREYLLPELIGYWEFTDVQVNQRITGDIRYELNFICRYLALATNYLALNMNAYGFREDFVNRYPLIFREWQTWSDDMEYLETEDLKMAKESNGSQWKDMLNFWNSRAENGIFDIEHDLEQKLDISGIPDLLYPPEWYDPETAEYFCVYRVYDDDSSNLMKYEIGEELTDSSPSFHVLQANVSRQQIEEYMSFISDYYDVIYEDDMWLVIFEQYAVGFTLEDNDVSILFMNESCTFM